MVTLPELRANLLVKLGEVTGKTHALPLVLFAPTARCNSRCVSCDWWRADGAGDLSLTEIDALASELVQWGTRTVVLTGGEPLVRADVMDVADVFVRRGMRLHLLTSGLALERFAARIAARFDRVTVSLDGHTAELYRAIRGVDGLGAVEAGVRALRAMAPGVEIGARSTVHRHNFRHMRALIDKARAIGCDSISFLPADVSSAAFNAQPGASRARLLLERSEVDELGGILESIIREYGSEIARGEIAPDAERLRYIADYYRAQLGLSAFPPVRCNAPWTSVFIEAHGDVRPCFFHPPVGNLRARPLGELLGEAMPQFRRGLHIQTNPVCERCVCTLKTGLRSSLS